jgi:hypothetical protein
VTPFILITTYYMRRAQRRHWSQSIIACTEVISYLFSLSATTSTPAVNISQHLATGCRCKAATPSWHWFTGKVHLCYQCWITLRWRKRWEIVYDKLMQSSTGVPPQGQGSPLCHDPCNKHYVMYSQTCFTQPLTVRTERRIKSTFYPLTPTQGCIRCDTGRLIP